MEAKGTERTGQERASLYAKDYGRREIFADSGFRASCKVELVHSRREWRSSEWPQKLTRKYGRSNSESRLQQIWK